MIASITDRPTIYCPTHAPRTADRDGFCPYCVADSQTAAAELELSATRKEEASYSLITDCRPELRHEASVHGRLDMPSYLYCTTHARRLDGCRQAADALLSQANDLLYQAAVTKYRHAGYDWHAAR